VAYVSTDRGAVVVHWTAYRDTLGIANSLLGTRAISNELAQKLHAPQIPLR